QQGHFDPGFFVFLVELHAKRLELGDVGVVVVGDVRNQNPVAVQIGAGDLLDSRQRSRFDRAELGEIYLRPWQQTERGASRAGDRVGDLGAAHDLLDVILDVLLQDAPGRAAALYLRQVDTQCARVCANRR